MMNDMKKRSGKLILVIMGLTVCIAGLFWGLYATYQRQQEIERQLEMYRDMELVLEEKKDSILSEAEPVITSDTVVERLNSLGELVTVEYLYTNADKYENQNQVSVHKWSINLPFTTKSFLLAYDGRIKAGVDLKDIRIEVEEKSRRVTVILPKSKITSHEIFEDNIRVFDEREDRKSVV